MKRPLSLLVLFIVSFNVWAITVPIPEGIHIFYAFPQGETYNQDITLGNKKLRRFADDLGFKIVPHFKATRYDLEYVMRHTKGMFFVLWSSHGGSDGTLYDYYGSPIPKDIFDSKKCDVDGYPLGVLISSCYSGVTAKTYSFGNTRVITTGALDTVTQIDFKRVIDKWLVGP